MISTDDHHTSKAEILLARLARVSSLQVIIPVPRIRLSVCVNHENVRRGCVPLQLEGCLPIR